MIGWLDCSSGVSGDMLLGALVGVGVPLPLMQVAVDAVAPEPVALHAEPTSRGGVAAVRVRVEGAESTTHRTWGDVRSLLEPVRFTGREGALSTFAALASAEAAVHGTTPEDVHFHEVGALDAIADIVAASAGLAHLGLTELVASPVALGGGTVRAAHGRISVPGPAVVRLLVGVPTYGGPVDVELATPTGAALLVTHVTGWGHQPLMRSTAQGFGAGSRDLAGHANVVRLVLGDPAPAASRPADEPSSALVLETNVDDMDPRIWPGVLAALLAAGADDAWLTPILMKKGRPAHTLSVLLTPESADAVRGVVFGQTSAIGVRERRVTKFALPRATVTVDVDGHPVRVKTARHGGRLVNAQPEWDDVAAVALAVGRPAKSVLAQAVAASEHLIRSQPAGEHGT